MNTDVMRGQLRARYEPALSFMRTAAADYTDVSHPLLISVPDGYAASAIRLMIVGQETYGWGQTEFKKAVPSMDALLELYTQFDMGAHYVRSPFWRAAHDIHAALNPTSPRGAFVWTNVNKLDLARHRIPSSLEARLDADDLLLEEIRITEPQVIVFFTGPRYDGRLRSAMPGAKLSPLSEPELGHVARVEHERLPKHSYRTYHPAYLQRSRQWPTIAALVPLLRDA